MIPYVAIKNLPLTWKLQPAARLFNLKQRLGTRLLILVLFIWFTTNLSDLLQSQYFRFHEYKQRGKYPKTKSRKLVPEKISDFNEGICLLEYSYSVFPWLNIPRRDKLRAPYWSGKLGRAKPLRRNRFFRRANFFF